VIESIVKLTDNATYRLRGNKVVCDSIEGTWYYTMVQNVWKLIDMSIYAFIPFTIMLICSGIIIGRVAQQANKFSRNKKTTAVAAPAAVSGTNSLAVSKQNNVPGTPSATPQMKKKSNSTVNLNGGAPATASAKTSNEQKFSSRTRNLALMLIPVNILFLLFLAPVVLTIYFYSALSQDQLTLAIVELVSNCNFTLNFFIYFVTSSKFREEFYKFVNEMGELCCCCCCSKKKAAINQFNSTQRQSNAAASVHRQSNAAIANRQLQVTAQVKGKAAECVALLDTKSQVS
jgi:hypothetical protein